jgi:hypothetical protein
VCVCASCQTEPRPVDRLKATPCLTPYIPVPAVGISDTHTVGSPCRSPEGHPCLTPYIPVPTPRAVGISDTNTVGGAGPRMGPARLPRSIPCGTLPLPPRRGRRCLPAQFASHLLRRSSLAFSMASGFAARTTRNLTVSDSVLKTAALVEAGR